MSDWKPCQTCLDRREAEGDTDSVEFLVCEECRISRRDKLSPILMDRGYRGHLANRVLGSACPSNCPEGPAGHATLDCSELRDESFIAYRDIVGFVLAQFARPQDPHSVTAFEILAGQNEVEDVVYCAECLRAASENLEENKTVLLCGPCLQMRNHHVRETFKHQPFWSQPWEVVRNSRLAIADEHWDGHAALGYDMLVECYGFEQIGGFNPSYLLKAAQYVGNRMGLFGGVASIVYGYVQHQDNMAILRETVRNNEQTSDQNQEHNNRMYDLAKSQFELELRRQRFSEWQSRAGASTNGQPPDRGTQK